MLAVLAALSSCASRSPLAPREIFDEQTASTLTVVAAPLVFSRPRSDVAAFAHDFATLVAAQDDRSGETSEFLLLYRWSTVDPRMSPPPPPEAGRLRILADGRQIDLQPLGRLPVSLMQRHALLVPHHGDVVARAYRVDAGLLNFIASSRALTLRMPEEALDTPFTLWEDGRKALRQFLRAAGSP